MKAMVILRRCRTAGEEIERIEEKIRQRIAAAGSMGSPLDGNRGRGGPSDKTGRLAAEIADLKTAKERREFARSAEIAAAVTLLDCVPIRESKVLHAYWIEGKSTGEIARAKHYSGAYVRKTKRDGEMLLEMLDEEKVAGMLPKWYLEEYEEGRGGR